MMLNPAIIFMGTDSFAETILLKLLQKYKNVSVVTEPDKPSGRGLKFVPSQLKLLASQHRIPCWQPIKLSKKSPFYEEMKRLTPDLVIAAAYGKILPEEFLEIPKFGCLNIHPSLLPKYRGPSPIQTALLNGDKQTGVTIIRLNEKMDAGPIVRQISLNINNDDDYFSLEKKLAELGGDILLKTIPDFVHNKIDLIVQDEAQAVYCHKIKKEDGHLNWQKSAIELTNQIRAFVKWPFSYTIFNGKKLEIIKAQPMKLSIDVIHQIGEVFKYLNTLFVQCGQGCLRLEIIKLEGKRAMSIDDFVNGHQDFVGTILE